MSLDLQKLEAQLDDVLAAETEESLAEWMAGHPRTYYAFGDSARKTWFISRHNRRPEKTMVRLFVLTAVPTTGPIYHPDPSQPVAGTIARTIESETIEVKTCEWL